MCFVFVLRSFGQQGGLYLLVVGCDKPQLYVHVGAPLLCSEEVEKVVMPHPTQVVDFILIVP